MMLYKVVYETFISQGLHKVSPDFLIRFKLFQIIYTANHKILNNRHF